MGAEATGQPEGGSPNKKSKRTVNAGRELNLALSRNHLVREVIYDHSRTQIGARDNFHFSRQLCSFPADLPL